MELPAFKDDCSPQKNVVFERHQLWSHQRTAGTSVDRFITELRQKSKDCEFGMSENDMLRDKLVFSITDSPLKERLLQERGLTLHRAIEICRVTEQAKTPLQAMKTEHGMEEVPVDAGMKRILPDQSLHHNSRKHLGVQSVENMDQTEKLVLAAFMPKVQLHRFQLQQPSVTDCVFIERKNVEQQFPERLHIKEEPEMLSEGQEGNQLCRQQETNSSACPVQCEDKEEKPQASQLHWRQQTKTNIKEEPSTCTLDESMKRKTVVRNSKEPESARNPDPSSLVLQGTDGTTADSPHTEDVKKENDDDVSWQKPLSDTEDETNDFFSTSKKRKMFASSRNTGMGCKAAKTQISSNKKVQDKLKAQSVKGSIVCVGVKIEGLSEAGNGREKAFGCHIDSKYVTQMSLLHSHTRVQTGEKLFRCDVCQKCFIHPSSLYGHMRIHAGQTSFKCEVCNRLFNQKSRLHFHMRAHTREKPFKCDYCSKCFVRWYSLQSHVRHHTGETPYVCDVCTKPFTRKYYLARHMIIHTGEKPFKCEICYRCFTQKCSLQAHMNNIHTSEKSFQCDICLKSFPLNSNLTRHMRVHTKEKPFRCDICLKSFAQSIHLKKHMKVHTEEKPLGCYV